MQFILFFYSKIIWYFSSKYLLLLWLILILTFISKLSATQIVNKENNFKRFEWSLLTTNVSAFNDEGDFCINKRTVAKMAWSGPENTSRIGSSLLMGQDFLPQYCWIFADKGVKMIQHLDHCSMLEPVVFSRALLLCRKATSLRFPAPGERNATHE